MLNKKIKSIEPPKLAALQSKQLIYCGPNITKEGLLNSTVFKKGKPAHLKHLYQKCPAIEKLFIPIDEVVKAGKQIKKKGTPLNVFYQQVLEFLKKGGAR